MRRQADRQRDSQRPRANAGFTLVEVITVVAIIAVLVAIAIPMLDNSIYQAKRRADISNARAMYVMLFTDYMDDGQYSTAVIAQDANGFEKSSGSVFPGSSKDGYQFILQSIDGVVNFDDQPGNENTTIAGHAVVETQTFAFSDEASQPKVTMYTPSPTNVACPPKVTVKFRDGEITFPDNGSNKY